jgi:nitrogen fixation protein NifB
MAVATKGGGVINEHFGHAREFLIYEASASWRALHRPPQDRPLLRRRRHLRRRRRGPRCSSTLRELAGCEVVLCSKIGYEPWSRLEAAGIMPNGEHAMEPIEEAVAAVYEEMCAAGKLAPRAAAEAQRAA